MALDLASFEVVRAFHTELRSILSAGQVACCFCNEVCLSVAHPLPPPIGSSSRMKTCSLSLASQCSCNPHHVAQGCLTCTLAVHLISTDETAYMPVSPIIDMCTMPWCKDC